MMNSHSYNLIQDEDDYDIQKKENDASFGREHFSRVISILIVTVVACVLVNICLVVFLYAGTILGWGYPKEHSAQLKRPSTYIGLDRLYTNTTAMKKYPPIQNEASRFFQISPAQPTMQLAMEAPKVAVPTGFIPAAHGFYQLLVTPEVSTLVEFRGMDYGMENCSLTLNIPSRNTSDRTTIISGTHLEVWAVGLPNSRIDRKKISWNTRPRRSQFIATVPIHYGALQTLPSFVCPSGLHFTFEISCNDCYLNVTRTSDKVHDAFYLVQSQSMM